MFMLSGIGDTGEDCGAVEGQVALGVLEFFGYVVESRPVEGHVVEEALGDAAQHVLLLIYNHYHPHTI